MGNLILCSFALMPSATLGMNPVLFYSMRQGRHAARANFQLLCKELTVRRCYRAACTPVEQSS